LTKSYIYSNNGQILCQRDGGQSADEYFYVNDRLGSVRQVIDSTGDVERNYTYSPFGQLLESGGTTPSNPFMFTGQWFDDKIDQYYLRARMYDPQLMRFTSRDPVRGKFNHPLTLHVYLYCLNDPINRIDPMGEMSFMDIMWVMKHRATTMASGMGGYVGKALLLAKRIYAAAFCRAVQIDMLIYGVSAGSQNVRIPTGIPIKGYSPHGLIDGAIMGYGHGGHGVSPRLF
jgi:RHS repeat-associated protein